MNIQEVLSAGREVLMKNGVDPREARLLLAFVMKIKNEELIKYKECSQDVFKQFIEIINKRANGEPFAYIVGNKEFMKLNFKVTSDVLIPREETEILVQEIISLINDNYFKKFQNISNQDHKTDQYDIENNNNTTIKILDMCTGSGCIAISLAKYLKKSEVTAVDISEKALKVARENAIINNVEIDFVKSNLFENFFYKSKEIEGRTKLKNNEKKFDIIVSNPPYIKKDNIKTLQREVKNEPIIALDGGDSGLEFYEKITSQSKDFLKYGGILAYEIGFDQGEAVYEIMKKNGFEDIIIKKDISKNDRVIIGRKK